VSDVDPGLFDFVVEYAKIIVRRRSLPEKLDGDHGLVLFCRSFFEQFLASEFDVTVESFTSRAAVDAWITIKPRLERPDVRTGIVAAFREFCQDYETVVGERYDRGGQIRGFQEEFVPDLLESIAAWGGESEVGLAAANAREDLTDAVEKVYGSS
jgi:hypothetical protein